MMKQVLVELPAELLARLDKVAPGKSRKRSEFIRTAIRKALWDAEEQATANAYAKQPDSATDAYFDPTVWEAPKRKPRSRT
jgi:predicted transcriptional regulator